MAQRLLKHTVVASGVTMLMLLSLTACSIPESPVSSSKVTEEATAETTNCPEAGPWGDVISDELITDEFGTYCSVKINPEADVLKYDESKLNAETLAEFGFTKEDILAVLPAAVNFTVEEASDSQYLESKDEDTLKQWYEQLEDYKFEGYDPLNNGVILWNQYPMIRDSNPRVNETHVELVEITAQESVLDASPMIVVDLAVHASYRMSNDNALLYSVEAGWGGKTTEEVIANNPMFSNNEEKILPYVFTYKLGFNKTYDISGHAYTFTPQQFLPADSVTVK